MPEKSKFHQLNLYILIAICTLLSSCNMPLIFTKGVIATDERNIIIVATLLMLIVVLPVMVMTVLFAWKYRASNTKAQHEPNWAHSTKIELLMWAVPCAIIIVLGTITWKTSHSLDPYKPLDIDIKPVTIEAVALDWKWLFIYPEQKIATINFIQIPINVPINFKVTADAPMNALWIPALAGQVYAMAGMTTKLHIMANESGTYRGLSGSYSGAGFSDMKFIVQASTEEEFEQWVNKVVSLKSSKLDTNLYNELIKPSEKNPVQYFSSVQDNLFDDIVMKFMMRGHYLHYTYQETQSDNRYHHNHHGHHNHNNHHEKHNHHNMQNI